VLRNDIVPFERVYDHPRYQWNAFGLKVPDGIFVHVAAFDLARDEQGRWVMVEDYVGKTTGVTYALSARNVLSQAAPELLETADLLPVQTYPTNLLEHLRRFARGTPEPRVVLLPPGIFNSARYEHSLSARQMDVPPMKAIFQGRNAQSLSMQVRVTRNADTTAPLPASADADGERPPRLDLWDGLHIPDLEPEASGRPP